MPKSITRFATLLLILIIAVPTSVSAFPAEGEAEFLAVLQSDAAPADKAIACKSLAIYGSDAAVPELAKLLPNPQLSSWARIALEAIPGDASNKALRDAAESLDGQLLVGVINSLSARRDEKAVDSLIEKLNDADAEVASAAAVALGNIGNADATKSLRAALAESQGGVRSAVAEGLVLCAERLHNAGESVAAAEVYDEVRSADVPMQRVIEATRGAILAREQDGIPLLVEILRSPEEKLFQLALGTAREFPGGEVDKTLVAELASATPERAALIVQAMADRPDTVSLAAVLKSAEEGDTLVRLSAIEALQRVGDDSCLNSLLKMATGKDAELATAAQQTLAVLPGQHVDGEIGVLLPSTKGDTYRVLLQVVGQRRIPMVDEVVKALDHSDDSIRSAALVALGETVSLKQMDILVSQVIRPGHAEDLPVAQQALKAASVRMPDRDACATELTNALNRAPASAKTTLLEIITDVGGNTALQTLARAAKSSDPQLQDAGSRLLGTWNGVAAAPVLLDLAKTGPEEKYRVRALRGYLGLARKFTMPEQDRVEMCQNAFDATRRISEHKLTLDVLKIHPSLPGLKLAIKATNDPALKSDATAAAKAIAQKIKGKKAEANKLLADAGIDQ